MITTLYAKLIGAAILLAVLAGAAFWLHHSGVESGKATVQAKWDAEKAAQVIAVAKAKDQAETKYAGQVTDFSKIDTTFQEQSHAQVPSVADALSAGFDAGAFRLRDNPVCSSGSYDKAAAASSRKLDAAATSALAQRVANSIAAIRVGEQADARERYLRAQVTGLQEIVRAERK